MERKLMTTQEMADELRITYDVANNLLRAGEIAASKVGGGWRIRPEAIDLYLERTSNQNRRDKRGGERCEP